MDNWFHLIMRYTFTHLPFLVAQGHLDQAQILRDFFEKIHQATTRNERACSIYKSWRGYKRDKAVQEDLYQA